MAAIPLLGSFLLLALGGQGQNMQYDPVLHVLRAVKKTPAKAKQGTAKQGASKEAQRTKPMAKPKARSPVRATEATARRLKPAPKPGARAPRSRSLPSASRIATSIQNPRQRRVLLPLLHHLTQGDWHLRRGQHQGRSSSRALQELNMALAAYRVAAEGLARAQRRFARSSPLAERLDSIGALLQKGRTQAWLAKARLALRRNAPKAAQTWLRRAEQLDPAYPGLSTLKARIDRSWSPNDS